MPLQNRVTPSGEIVAGPSRGLIMGNLGCLHGQARPGAGYECPAGKSARTLPAGPMRNCRTSGS
jgi:hypothetical protein